MTLILRENGRIEVYSDFEYTNAFNLSPLGRLCVDIENDHNFFYLKYWEPEASKEKKFTVRKVAHKWRSRIKYNYTEDLPDEAWTTVADSKFSKYFKIYKNFINFMYLFFMAHRNYVSTFDMSLNNGKGKWVSHKKICDNAHVREIVLQERHKHHVPTHEDEIKFHGIKHHTLFQNYHLLVFYGTDYLAQMYIRANGKLVVEHHDLKRNKGDIMQI